MPYSSEQFLDLFESAFMEAQNPEERLELLRHGDVFRYRVKTYRAGNMLESEIFPIWNTQGEASRAVKARRSRPAQEKLNHRNIKKKISRYANHNFTDADVWGTFGYDDDNIPESPEQARRDVVNYIRRLKRKRRKARLPPIRYMYVTEYLDTDGEEVRVHHHVIMSGDMDRDALEKEWHGGAYPQVRRLQPKDCGITGLAYYLAKGTTGQMLWGHSKNLKMPVPTVADKKITKRQLEKLAINRNTAPAFFEKAYAGYVFQDTERDLHIMHSDYVAGAYIYAQMHRAPPPRKPPRGQGKSPQSNKPKTKPVATKPKVGPSSNALKIECVTTKRRKPG